MKAILATFIVALQLFNLARSNSLEGRGGDANLNKAVDLLLEKVKTSLGDSFTVSNVQGRKNIPLLGGFGWTLKEITVEGLKDLRINGDFIATARKAGQTVPWIKMTGNIGMKTLNAGCDVELEVFGKNTDIGKASAVVRSVDIRFSFQLEELDKDFEVTEFEIELGPITPTVKLNGLKITSKFVTPLTKIVANTFKEKIVERLENYLEPKIEEKIKEMRDTYITP